jgi:negative modulator of initiation of replication
MKRIELDDELYHFIASQTQHIGESASDILRRLLGVDQKVRAVHSSSVSGATPVLAHESTTTDSAAFIPANCAPKPATQPKAKPTSKQAVVVAPVGHPVEASKVVQALLQDPSFTDEPKSIVRFLSLLSALYHADPAAFAAACEIKGKKRAYFAQTAEALQAAGTTTRPRSIPETPFWVITNTNTGRKRIILAQLMAAMGISEDAIDMICQAI